MVCSHYFALEAVPSKQEEGNMERVMGIGPTSSAWEAGVLPLNYTRIGRIVTKMVRRVNLWFRL